MKPLLSLVLLCLFSNHVMAMSLDEKLRIAIELNNLKPKDCSITQYSNISDDQFRVGELLFETKMLSGNKDISCRDCHLDEFNSTDGLPLAVGVSGKGKGEKRYLHGKGILVQRNAFSLKGRGDPQFINYFWDGKLDTNSSGEIISQFGDLSSPKFDAPLSVASVLPLIERDEFLGEKGILSENDIRSSVGDKLYQQRYLAISKAIRIRILNDEDDEVQEIRAALRGLKIDLNKLELADIGNLIGRFIAKEFACQTSDWDKYIAGNQESLTPEQKKGAVLFYGRGRCSACHSGNFQSDYSFHSIGTPQGSFGPHSRHRDLGRAAVTLKQKDLFKFRTPPLNEVSKSGPFGHNGIFKTLREIIIHHVNPIQIFLDGKVKNTYVYGKILDSRSSILSSISIREDDDIDALISFMSAL